MSRHPVFSSSYILAFFFGTVMQQGKGDCQPQRKSFASQQDLLTVTPSLQGRMLYIAALECLELCCRAFFFKTSEQSI